MALNQAGSSLDSLISSFNTRIAELQELVIARNMYPASSITDLSAVDTSLAAIELQIQAIKNRLREEAETIPKAKKLIEASLRQQKILQSISVHVPSYISQRATSLSLETEGSSRQEDANQPSGFGSIKLEEDPVVAPKEKKGRGPAPLWFITAEELDSLPSYMRGRLTLDKVNAALSDMAAYAEANSQLISAPKKKLAEDLWEKALAALSGARRSRQNWPNSIINFRELRDIAMKEGVKGKHFFLETDIKGPSLKLDHTGKATLTVLRHLGRISETRIGHHRVIMILKPH